MARVVAEDVHGAESSVGRFVGSGEEDERMGRWEDEGERGEHCLWEHFDGFSGVVTRLG